MISSKLLRNAEFDHMMSSKEMKPVKVKIIETRFIKADAGQFRSVVQSLTGKESVAAAAGEPSKRQSVMGVRSEGMIRKKQDDEDYVEVISVLKSGGMMGNDLWALTMSDPFYEFPNFFPENRPEAEYLMARRENEAIFCKPTKQKSF
ncbi:uncharacterized protein A4U43_C05F28110 [Asparagus officinalis]|uniref:VQ domain-containing protein n=1 Tax=Asparagus officinalis TaxID=4686 RepID=A0A5P1EZD2_ASPOF|nr:uncharacterized protein A4U43_C05F28110 [Asparagus officinalis]